jgi:hypothetical protein
LRTIGPSSDNAISEYNSIRWTVGTMTPRRHLGKTACCMSIGSEVPEAAKTREIEIGTTVEPAQPQVTQQKAA